MLYFFFQAEDGIRVLTVTGVQTCALPICMAEYSQPLSVLVVGIAASLGDAASFDLGDVGVSESVTDISLGKMSLDDSIRTRSEERRVGKECRSRWSPNQ